MDEKLKMSNTYTFDFEHKEQALAKNLIKPGMTVFDVGANIGHFTRLYSELVKDFGHVYSFEPSKDTFDKLQKNAALQNVKLINLALYSSIGTHLFYEFEPGFGVFNSLQVPNIEHRPVRSIFVQTITLDEFCRQNNIFEIDFLKLDTEGAELDILKGSKELLSQKKIKSIQFEISIAFLNGFQLIPLQVFNYLQDYGYECHIINQDGSIGVEVKDTDTYQDNFIAFPCSR